MTFHSLAEVVKAVRAGDVAPEDVTIIVDNDSVYLSSDEHVLDVDGDGPEEALVSLLHDLGLKACRP